MVEQRTQRPMGTSKSDFDTLPELVATVAFYYEPQDYLEQCADNGETPTLEGWKDYAFDLAWDDFNNQRLHPTVHDTDPFNQD